MYGKELATARPSFIPFLGDLILGILIIFASYMLKIPKVGKFGMWVFATLLILIPFYRVLTRKIIITDQMVWARCGFFRTVTKCAPLSMVTGVSLRSNFLLKMLDVEGLCIHTLAGSINIGLSPNAEEVATTLFGLWDHQLREDRQNEEKKMSLLRQISKSE